VASHASAVKAHRQSLKRREQNRQFRARLRSALRKTRAAVAAGNSSDARQALRETASLIDRMVSKGIIHRNAGARYKSRLVKGLGRPTTA
jgi:small subunit ribosomal protein S20